MAGLPAALGAVHQNRKAAPGQKLDRLGNGRKLRGIEAADPQSIIADDGNIVRDALSGVHQCADRADGNDVCHGEHSCDLRCVAQDGLHTGIAILIAVTAGMVVGLLVELHAVFPERFHAAFITLRGRIG